MCVRPSAPCVRPPPPTRRGGSHASPATNLELDLTAAACHQRYLQHCDKVKKYRILYSAPERSMSVLLSRTQAHTNTCSRSYSCMLLDTSLNGFKQKLTPRSRLLSSPALVIVAEISSAFGAVARRSNSKITESFSWNAPLPSAGQRRGSIPFHPDHFQPTQFAPDGRTRTA